LRAQIGGYPNNGRPSVTTTGGRALKFYASVRIDNKKTETLKEYVWVVYFHRVPGCDTCQLMSKYIFETVNERFGDDVKGKKIVLHYRNFEEKKNADLVKKLGIKSPMLAVIQIKDGKMVKAKLADKIWSLAAEKKKFIDYVEKEIETYTDEFKKGDKK
jgi:hypothetical protein